MDEFVGIVFTSLFVGAVLFLKNRDEESKQSKSILLDIIMMLFPIWLPLLWIGSAIIGILDEKYKISFVIFYASLFICIPYAFMFFCTTFYSVMKGNSSMTITPFIVTVACMLAYSVFTFFTVFFGGWWAMLEAGELP